MNILLVEDEPPILRQIEYYIKKFGEPYHIIASASDGQSAKEIIDQHQDKIDFILTDIQIPIINGLELIRYVRDRYPDIICSVLTGYDDFNYAQKAVRLKTFDYILKPIEEEILSKHLAEVYEYQCLKCVGLRYRNGSSESQAMADTTFIYRQILINIGQFSYGTDEFEYQGLNTSDTNTLNEILISFKKHFVNYWLIPHKHRHTFFVLFSFNETQLKNIQFLYYDLYAAFQMKMRMVTIITSDTPIELQNINAQMQKLCQFAEERILFAKSSFLQMQAEKESSCAGSKVVFSEHITQLSRLFTDGSKVLFNTELKTFIYRLESPFLTQAVIKVFLTALFTQCTLPYLDYPYIRQIDFQAVIDDIIIHSESLNDLYANVVPVFDDIYAFLIGESIDVGGKTGTLIKIDHYIKENYAASINTKIIADRFGFTPGYLSKLFRDYKQMTPAEYISHLRIDKAKVLLQSGRALSIKEIAEAIGFDDPLYFSKVFKKLTGTTPKSFQGRHK